MLGDAIDEPDESFFVQLSNPQFAALTTNLVTGTILNDDTITIGTVTVAITNPPDGSIFYAPPGLIPIAATAQVTQGTVQRVDFFASPNSYLGAVTNPPYSLRWSNNLPGSYLLTAVATSASGATGTSAPVHIQIVRSNVPPTVSIISPSEGVSFTVPPGVVPITANAQDSDGTVQRVDFYSGLSLLGTVTNAPFTLQWVTSALGTNTLVAVATDNAGATATSAPVHILIVLSNAAPIVSIVSPTDGTRFTVPPGLVSVTADARDPDGTVQRVDFYSDTTLMGTVTSAPFTTQWVTSTLGTNLLVAVATDNSGAKATSAPVRIVLAPCSGVLTAIPLANQAACICETVVFNAGASSPEPVSFVWRANGQVIPAQTQSNLVLQSLKTSDAGTYSVEITGPCKRLTNTARLTISGDGIRSPLVVANTNRIVIRDADNAVPYPSPISFTCVPGVLSNISVTISNLSHTSAHDVDIWLTSPDGRGLRLMSDAGRAATHATLVFSDNATASLPPKETGAPVVSGLFKPTDYLPNDDSMPGVVTKVLTNLAGFQGSILNGTWGLYVTDDEFVDEGEIAGGWSMTIDWEDTAPRLAFPSNLVDGRFQMVLLSQPGRTHLIEASTDLMKWLPVSTNTMAGSSMLLSFPAANTFAKRFFRVVRCPNFDLFNVDLPPRLTSPRTLGGGLFQLTLNATPARSYVIEASANLRQWIPVSTNQMSGPQMPVVVPSGPLSARFYRAITAP